MRNTTESASLSPVQLGVWSRRAATDHIDWPDHLAFGARLRGDLDQAALRRALDGLLARHELWRTTFADEGGEPRQRLAGAAMPLATFDLSGRPPAQREAQAERILADQVRRTFKLDGEPPVRACLVRLEEREHALLIVAHPLAADAWTWEIIARDLSALHRGVAAGAEPPALQYRELAAVQRERLEPALADHLAWWRERLRGAPPVLDLPADRSRLAQPGHAGGVAGFNLPAPAVASVAAAGDAAGASLFTTLLAGFAALLARLGGQDEVVIASPLPARDRRELRGLVGPAAQPVPLRIDCSGAPSFAAFAARVQDAVSEADAHREVPFDRLVGELGVERGASHHPIAQAGFALMDAPWEGLDLAGVEASELTVQGLPIRLDLDLALLRSGDDLLGRLRYSADLFDPETAGRLGAQLVTLLEDAAAHPERPISRLALLDERERERVLVDCNRTEAPFPGDALAHELFEARAAERPGAPAIVGPGEPLTYGELNRRANRLAHRLRRLGAGPERPVAVFLPRSADAVVAFLAALKSGGAYLPLDPLYPRERLEHICADAGVAVTVTCAALAPELPAAGGRVLVLDREAEELAAEPDANPEALTDPLGLVYVIYTSGSTGVPKGVEVAHRGLVNLTTALTRQFRLRPEDRVVLFASLGFDASVWEMAMALFNGSGLYVLETADKAPEEIGAELQEAGVTAGTFPPSFLRALMGRQPLSSIRLMVAAGEQCQADLVRAWGGGRTFVNAYGPTETTVCATWARCEPGAAFAPPIGEPLPNVQVHVLDQEAEPVPAGVPGELHIAGVGLARGYRNQPGQTAAAFGPNPYGPPGSRMYRSGDVASRRSDGAVQYLGRVDHQLKVRGFRVEPGEVQAAVARHPGVREAVVTARADAQGDTRLVAYLVLAAEARAIASRSSSVSGGLRGDLHRFLASSLPAYMLPSAYVVIDDVPLSPTGKIDRSALPEPDLAEALLEDRFSGPQTPTEEAIAAMWARVLGLERVSRDDNFLEVGGHSLVAAQVVAQLRSKLGVRLPVRMLFEHPVLSEFAAAVDAANGAAAGAAR